MSNPVWTSTLPGFLDQFPKAVGDLWVKTKKPRETLSPTGVWANPVFGEGSTWYFWDETWGDACGPYDTEHEANQACDAYANNL